MTTDSQVLDRSYAWKRLWLSLLIAVVGNVGMWAIITIMPAIEAEFSIPRAQTSLPYTFTMIGYALGNFLVGRIIDRFGVTIVLCGASTLSATCMLLVAINPLFYLLVVLQIGIGIGTAAFFGPLIADVSLWFLKRRGIAVAITASGNYLSGALWPWLLKDILDTHGWQVVYMLLAGVLVSVVIPLSFTLRRRLPDNARQQSDAVSNARTLASGIPPQTIMWLLALAGVGCCVAMSMPQVHIISFCVDLGYGAAVGSQMLSLMLLGGVVSRLLSGLLADWLGGVRTLLIGSTLQCLALFLFLPFDSLVSLYLISLAFGLSQGGIVPSYAVIVREYMPTHEAGRRVGFVMFITFVGMALGGWMSGWIYDLSGSYELAFLNGIGWNLLNIFIMYFLMWRTTHTPRSPAQAGT